MVKTQAEANVPTDYGNFRMIAFSENENDWMPHMALIAENTDFSKPVNVRFHSECITGEVFHSKKCECGQQLDSALKYTHENGGIIVYLRKEGRNIGIINKLKAYALQEKGMDTVEANIHLGFDADPRDYGIGAQILASLGIKKMKLITNNPQKRVGIESYGLEVTEQIPIEIEPNDYNKDYLLTKKK